MWLCMHSAHIIAAAKNYPSFSMSIHQPMSLYKKKIAPWSSDGPEVIVRVHSSNSNWLSQCAVRKVIYFSYRLGKKEI